MSETFGFRLLETGFHNAYYNMGLDEALLETAAAGGSPIFRLYGWNPPAVSVGYFQGLEEEVDTAACRRLGFDLVRRISGGGAVLHRSELTYSIIMKAGHPLAGKDIGDSYRLLGGGIMAGLKRLGIDSEFSGINDILAGGRKVSGNAQTRRLGCVLQHGTILLDNDVDIMFEVLKVPLEKIKGKLIEEVKERVTSLRSVLGRPVPFEEVSGAFLDGFSEALGLVYEHAGQVTAAEDQRARILAKDKFSSPQWIHKR